MKLNPYHQPELFDPEEYYTESREKISKRNSRQDEELSIQRQRAEREAQRLAEELRQKIRENEARKQARKD